MAAKGYTTEGAIENYLGVDIDSSFATQIDEWIEAVENWIDRYCGTTFVSSADETRRYDSDGGTELTVDPFTAITTLVTLDVEGATDLTLTEGAANDFITYPLNDTEKTKVVLTPVAQTGAWPSGRRRVAITGRFRSVTSVPLAIKLAATKLVAAVVDRSLRGGKLSGETLGDYRADFEKINEHAEALGIFHMLDQYKVYGL